MDDSKIIDLFLAREECAVAETQKKYGTGIRRIIGRVLRDGADIEECENDTYLSAWTHIPPKEPREHFFAYLAAIARGHAIDRCRAVTSGKRNAELTALTDELAQCLPAPGSVEDGFHERELCRLISAFLRTLPGESRILFLCRYWQMETVEELAEKFALSKGNVRTRLCRIRTELKAYLEKEGYTV